MTIANAGIRRLVLVRCQVDVERGVVHRPDGAVTLTGLEHRLLAYLAQREGTVVSRSELLEQVWGYSARAVTRTVDVTVARLRRKLLDNARFPVHLESIYGSGYRLVL